MHSIVRAEVGSSDCSLKPKWAKQAVIHKYCQKTLTAIKNYFRYTKNSRASVITLSRFALENLVFLSKAYSFVFDCSLSLPFQPYYNHHILSLLQPLVTSGTSPAQVGQARHWGSSRWKRAADCTQVLTTRSTMPPESPKLPLLPLSERWLTGVTVSSTTERCFMGEAFILAAASFGLAFLSLVSFSRISLCSWSCISKRQRGQIAFFLY